MENISELTNRVHPLSDSLPSGKSANDSKTETSTSTKLNYRHIEQLWEKLTAMFGHKMTSTFGEEVDPTGVWLLCLQGLTPQQIANGLTEVTRGGFEWPPGAPQFRTLCLPSADSLGLPSVDAAYDMYCKITNTMGPVPWDRVHSVVYYTSTRLDAFTMKRAKTSEHRSRFLAAYKRSVEKAAAGFIFPRVPLPLEHTEPELTDEERAKKRTGMGSIVAEYWKGGV